MAEKKKHEITPISWYGLENVIELMETDKSNDWSEEIAELRKLRADVDRYFTETSVELNKRMDAIEDTQNTLRGLIVKEQQE